MGLMAIVVAAAVAAGLMESNSKSKEGTPLDPVELILSIWL